MDDDALIRPMRPEDVAAAERLTDEGFFELEQRSLAADRPAPSRRSDLTSAMWRRRLEHVLAHDAAGCWVAEDARGLVGASAALRRELTWILATYLVRPDAQGRGIGRQLLDASLSYGRGCLRGMLVGSSDPRAARRYRLAGFTLHPTMVLSGSVAREVLPVVDRVREGSPADVELMDSVDRRARDSAHGVDHEVLSSLYRLVVVDRSTGSGYAYVEPGGGPYLLAATNRKTATDLLWETLAATDPGAPCEIRRVTAPNEWAVDVGLAAGLMVHSNGYLALRHMKPPMPYLPSDHFL